MRRSLLILLLMCLLVPVGSAQALDYEEERHHVTFNGDAGPNAFAFGLGYHYMVLPSLGLGASVGLWGDPEDVSDALRDYGYGWDTYRYDPYWDDYYYGSQSWSNIAFYFEPSLLLRTPYLKLGTWCALGLSVNPWFRISTNHYSSSWTDATSEIPYRSRCWAVGARVGPTFRFSAAAVTLGYSISNLDVDREYRTARTFKRLPQHSFSFALAVYF